MPAARARWPQKLVFAVAICIVAIWARAYFPAHFAGGDRMSIAAKDGIAAQSRPLLAALERYRADVGSYPTGFDRLTPKYLRNLADLPQFIYSAPESDWIAAGDGCAKRRDSLHRFALLTAAQRRAEADSYIAACVTGFRSFDLQSNDLPASGHIEIERWAHYDSRGRQWVLGWCALDHGEYGGATQTVANGVCQR